MSTNNIASSRQIYGDTWDDVGYDGGSESSHEHELLPVGGRKFVETIPLVLRGILKPTVGISPARLRGYGPLLSPYPVSSEA